MNKLMIELGAVGARQIKAARALLDWSQEDLAQATALSIATIRKLELGHISPRSSTTNMLRRALEEAGIEFLDNEGVRRRAEDIATFEGVHGYRMFLEDIEKTVLKTGGDVLIVAASEGAFQYLGSKEADACFDKMLVGNMSAQINILLIGNMERPANRARLACRALSTNYVAPMPFCVYGNKYAFVAATDQGRGKIIVIQSLLAAKASQKHFYSMWDKAIHASQAHDIPAYIIPQANKIQARVSN